MRVETKKVYYCDFCKKHSLRPLTKHEERCTGNPDRECYWNRGYGGYPHKKAGELRPIIEWLGQFQEVDETTLKELRALVDGCPACMLAAIRQSKPDDIEGFSWWGDFDFEREKERFNSELNEETMRREEEAAMLG